MARPTERADALPCSVVRSAPRRPVTGELSANLAGPCPETYSMLPTRTAILYLAIGRPGGGRVMASSFKRASAPMCLFSLLGRAGASGPRPPLLSGFHGGGQARRRKTTGPRSANGERPQLARVFGHD